MAQKNTSYNKKSMRGRLIRLGHDLARDKWLYFLLLPGILFFIIFRYAPMYGLRIAFMDYNMFQPSASKWVGLDQFRSLFTKPAFFKVMVNTLKISFLKLLFGFPLPIILALMMNEMKNRKFKRISQTLLYLPHFISWVILSGIIIDFLDPTSGLITGLLQSITGQRIQVLTSKSAFVPMLVVSDLYKGVGWGTIVYFAALSGVDPQLYEAAAIDGAGRFRQLIAVTLPAIMPTVILMAILNCNSILNAGFDQIFMLYNSLVMDVADIIDTYVYRIGIQESSYSFSTAVGMFKSVIALILIVSVNFAAKKSGNSGIW